MSERPTFANQTYAGHRRDEIVQLRAEIKKLQAENKRLRKALSSFTDHLDIEWALPKET